MNAGIIAAGEGSRLSGAFPDLPKPLVPVAGRPLIDWIVSPLKNAGIRSVTLLLNSRGRAVRAHLKKSFPEMQWVFVEKDTASSWESFRLVASLLAQTNERFVMSTADAMIPPIETRRFCDALQRLKADGAMALTPHVDDEKPLWAELGTDGYLHALGDRVKTRRLVTCGLYGLTTALAGALPPASEHARLRDFWIRSVEEGRRIAGVVLSKTLDIDRPEDVSSATAFAATMEES